MSVKILLDFDKSWCTTIEPDNVFKSAITESQTLYGNDKRVKTANINRKNLTV